MLDGSKIDRTGGGAFYIKGKVNVAKNATATFTTVNDIHFNYQNSNNTVKGSFVLEDGSTLNLTALSFQNYDSGGEIILGENAVLNAKTTGGVLATDKMTLGSSSSAKLNTKGAVSVGTLTLASGASLVFNSVQGASTHTLSSVVVGGDASIDFDGSNIHQGQVNIASLTNAKNENNEPITGTLTLSSNSNTSQRTIFNLEGGSYEGKIKVDMVQSSGDRKLALNIKDSEVAKNAVIELASKGGAVALGIGASEVKVKGITGTTGTIYAGAQGYDNSNVFSADGAVHTLVINTAGVDYDTSAAVVGKKDGAGNLHLTKHGAGKQSFNGNNQLGNVKVTGGELSFGGATTLGNLTFAKENDESDKNASRIVTFAANSTTMNDIDMQVAGNINFNLADGATFTTYEVGIIKTSGTDCFTRNISIESGVTVNAASVDNSWGLGTLDVDGLLSVEGEFKYSTGNPKDKGYDEGNIINGSGIIDVGSFLVANVGNVTLNVADFTSDSTTIINERNLIIEGGNVKLGVLSAAGSSLTADGGHIELLANATHTLGTLDASNGGGATGQVTLKQGAKLTVNAIWGTNGSSINLESGATLNSGVVSITTNVEGENAVIAASENARYGLSNDNNTIKGDKYTISNASVTVTSATNVDINNNLSNSSLQNAGTGKLNIINTSNTLTELVATGGDITIGGKVTMINGTQNLATMSNVTISKLDITTAADKTIQVSGNSSTAAGQMSGLLALEEGASLKLSNVTMSESSSVQGYGVAAPVVMAADVGGNITAAGNSVTLENTTVKLGATVLTVAQATVGNVIAPSVAAEIGAQTSAKVYTFTSDIFNGVALNATGENALNVELNSVLTVALYGKGYDYVALSFENSTIVSGSENGINVTFEDEALTHLDPSVFLADNTIYIAIDQIPEPTTATLSLLALAGLVARRRRK